MDYLDAAKDRGRLQKCLDKLRSADVSTCCVARHAKLYVFANLYVTEPLKQFCLQKLQKDLSTMEPSDANMEDLCEMLPLTYQFTSSSDNGERGIGKDLRDLVIRYAGWKAEVLLK